MPSDIKNIRVDELRSGDYDYQRAQLVIKYDHHHSVLTTLHDTGVVCTYYIFPYGTALVVRG